MKRRAPDTSSSVLPPELERFRLEDWIDHDEPLPDRWDISDEWMWRRMQARRRFKATRQDVLTAVGIDWRSYNRDHGWGER